MTNITDILEYRDSKLRLEKLSTIPTFSHFGTAELGSLVQLLTKVTLQQADLINGMMSDMSIMAHNYQQMQDQALQVSGQAYLSLEMLKEKGICNAEEIHVKWKEIEQEKILKPQGLEDNAELLTDEVNET